MTPPGRFPWTRRLRSVEFMVEQVWTAILWIVPGFVLMEIAHRAGWLTFL